MTDLAATTHHPTLDRAAVPVRWWILLLLCALALLSYVQRTSVAVAADQILPLLHLTQMQLGWLNAAFTTTYALSQLPGGVLGQRFGARSTLCVGCLIGVAATLGTPIVAWMLGGAALFIALLAAQCLLGMSQAPLFPVSAGTIERWFPTRLWALGNGVQTGAMNLGGAVTPLLIVLLSQHFGWQGALLWTAVPVAIVGITWGWYARNEPREHASVRPAELAELTGQSTCSSRFNLGRMRAILRDRNILLLTLAYLAMNFAYYLVSFWSYLYLVQVRGFHGIESGFAGMVPWLGAAAGAASGGRLSDRLGERYGPRRGYRIVPLVALPAAAALLLATTQVQSAYLAVVTLTLAFFAVELTEGSFWAGTMLVARTDTTAASGVLNTGGNAGGIICQPVVGWLTSAGNWSGAFGVGTLLTLMAAGLWLHIDVEQPLQTGPRRLPIERECADGS